MAPMPESKEIARAVRMHVLRSITKNVAKLHKAVVVQASPLSVELTANALTITEDSLVLGAWPRLYDLTWGIEVGDAVVMVPLDDGDWFVIDVLSESFMEGGLDLSTADHTVASTGAFGTMTGTMMVRDADGNDLGVVLLFDKASLH